MLKKIAMTAAAAGVMLSAAVPAFAAVNVGVGNGDIEQVNVGGVVNHVATFSNSGANLNLAAFAGEQSVDTGDATSVAQVSTQLNVNSVDLCGCGLFNVNLGFGNGDIEQSNFGFVANNVVTGSNTGRNLNGGLFVFDQEIETGSAASAAVVTSIVNTNIVE